MPREEIQSSPHHDTQVVVTWTPSQHLQLGIGSVAGYSLLDMMLARHKEGANAELDNNPEHGPLHRVGQAVERVVLDYQSRTEGSYTELGGLIADAITGNVESWTSLWVESLDRPSTQRLIRVLKRARNAVFGADE